MTMRDAVGAIKRDERPPFKGPGICEQCQRRHFVNPDGRCPYATKGQCATLGCKNPAMLHGKKYPKPGLYCAEHAAAFGGDSKPDESERRDFLAASAELAAVLGQLESLELHEKTYAHPALTVGILERTEIESRSRPGFFYKMARMVGSGWVHETADCQGWNERGHCRHADALNERIKN